MMKTIFDAIIEARIFWLLFLASLVLPLYFYLLIRRLYREDKSND